MLLMYIQFQLERYTGLTGHSNAKSFTVLIPEDDIKVSFAALLSMCPVKSMFLLDFKCRGVESLSMFHNFTELIETSWSRYVNGNP